MVTFRALVAMETAAGTFETAVRERASADLPDGDLLIRVRYSSLNYKDALSATGNRGVTRRYPHTPGIDAAGEVVESRDPAFAPGAPVLVIGRDLGMNTPGGYGQYIRVPAEWVEPLPAGLTLWEAMALGTAGFTAALAVDRLLQHGLTPGDGDILATGATGGVGSLAVALLAHLGFRVVAATGKADAHDWLRALGAAEVVERAAVVDRSRPLLRPRWAGAIDAVGGDMLASALAATRYGGAVAACGLAASPDLATTVYPFILRAVTLYGVDSVQCPAATRRRIWQQLAGPWKPTQLHTLARDCALEELSPEFGRILRGEQRGRLVVRLDP